MSEINLKLFTNYLTNRNQYVKFESCISIHAPISTGVPHSSILGPLLFSIYINDLVMTSSKLAIKYEKEVNNTEYVFLGQNRINWVDSVRHLDN